MPKQTAIMWFRQDLRLVDNPALRRASETGKVMPIYILDDINPGPYAMGGASRWWLHHSLTALHHDLEEKLNLFIGDPKTIILELVKQYPISAVFWNRCYEPWRIQRDGEIKSALKQQKIDTATFNASLLWEPWETLKSDGTPYKVFTPFYKRGCLGAPLPRKPLARPQKLALNKPCSLSVSIDDLKLLPPIPWDEGIANTWKVGEKSALHRLNTFIKKGLSNYQEGRNFPAKHSISMLSPYLHFGEISPHKVWHTIKSEKEDHNTQTFLSELAWREFSYSLLYHNPNLPRQNLQTKFDAFPWLDNKAQLMRWQKGLTGIPMVDAGMRELWQTGFMHNRVRMIVASFLVKNCLIHWHHGERWFWDCLVDADLANNSASWQWVAGCGADAAPYFRIFNPVTQGQKFDPTGEYTKHYLPELSKLPLKYLFNPWDAPTEVLAQSNLKLGLDYPMPMVDLKASRERALAAYQTIKQG